MVRYLKIFLVFLVAVWGLIGAFGNFARLDIAYESVRGVTSMPSFAAGEAPPWASENPIVIWIGVAIIIGGKVAAFVFGGYGVAAMLRNAGADNAVFQHAKRWAIMGCGFAVASLFGGFTVFGETAYLMFLDAEHVQAAAGAFRYGAFIALIMIFVAQPD